MTKTLVANQIECPKCHHAFALADSVEKDVREKLSKEYDERAQELREKLEKNLAIAIAESKRKEEEFASQKLGLEKEISRRVESERVALKASLKEEVGVELDSARQELEATAKKLKDAQAKELELRKQQRELEAARAEFELEAARKLDAERDAIRADVEGRVGQAHELKALEWKKKQDDMERALEEMRKKLEQGSQQLQGEVLELEVEATLREVFPHDVVEPVAKGVKGGDALQVVTSRTGAVAGSILWEVKRTKAFSEHWVTKLKDNQRSAKADVAVIITTALPEGVEHIGQVDGVWVTDFQSFTGIALALRASLIEVANAKNAQVGRREKAEEVYEYLNGVEFRGRVQALVESFVAMREDLEAEKRAFEKAWSKRDKQIVRALNASAGFYGDLQGLIGSSLQEIPQLTMDPK